MFDDKLVWSDEQIERILGSLLRSGVILAALVVLAGGFLFLVRHGDEEPHYAVFLGEPAELNHVPGIARQALTGKARGVIQLGLLLLIATPVARVAFSLFAFALQRDRTYVVVTCIVLTLLIFSLLGGGL
ncbi:MAG: DUF1634 domain-containing protein [bacterium]